MADSRRDRLRGAIRVSLLFHLLIAVVAALAFDFGILARTAGIALLPYWALVLLIVWKRGASTTTINAALVAYLFPILVACL